MKKIVPRKTPLFVYILFYLIALVIAFYLAFGGVFHG